MTDPSTEIADQFDDEYPDDEDCLCPSCDSLIEPWSGDILECSVCGCQGCPYCLLVGDDVFPYLCEDCDGQVEC